MITAKALCLTSCFILAGCGDAKTGMKDLSSTLADLSKTSAISPQMASCQANKTKAEIVTKDENVVWTSVSKFNGTGSVFHGRAANQDGYQEPITVNFGNQTCTLGNPNSEGRLVFVLQGRFTNPSI